MLLQGFFHGGITRVPGFEHHIGLHDVAAVFVGHADHAALGHGRVLQQSAFDLGAGDVVAGRDDHVVVAGLVAEVAVGIHDKGVAGQVPAVFHIVLLARVGQVFAARGAAHRQTPHHAGRHGLHVVVHNLRHITGHHLADAARTHLLARAGDVDVDHLGAANAVGHLDARGLFPQLAGGVGQGLACRHRMFEAAQVVLPGHRRHLAVHGGRGVALRDAVLGHSLQQGLGRVLFEQHGARAIAKRKRQQTTQAKRKGNRRCAADHVVFSHAQDVAREQVAHGQHIAVKVHGAFGLACGAAGESDQAHVIAAGGVWRVRTAVPLHALFQAIGRFAAEHHALLEARHMAGVAGCHAVLQFVGQQAVAQRGADLRFVDDLRQLARTQQRHGGHRHQTGLERAEQTSGHHGAVAAAQQNAVTGHEAHVLRQHLGDAVAFVLQLSIGPAEVAPARMEVAHAVQRDAVAPATLHMPVHQLHGAVELVGVIQFG